ncbi:hypothetical protein [Aureliella helgolandensis]|uniref:Uncharacterized protein n=1 Tax=Aureliella helgolandensis TaxID=2527968 RepID=A0A518GFV2_9BACT|nr:hypothetical protein [Aureliella helgolandensis]QDV27475.1 hypothetical protein Q31a_58640 [Aureliella helgolandensis]
MPSNPTQPTSNTTLHSGPGRLGYDFALLGLNARESRVEVIREAAGRTAARIQQAFPADSKEQAELLSDLATSTYRLLDPRNRERPFERIQLCIVSEGDLELRKGSRTPLLTEATQRVVAEPIPQEASKDAAADSNKHSGKHRRPGQCRIGTIALGALGILVTTTLLMACAIWL